MSVDLRPGVEADVPVLQAIYNHYVETSPATFDIEPRSLSDRLLWFAGFQQDERHRLLVAEQDGQPLGYAHSAPYRRKDAYAGTVETTIYLSPDRTGQGIGRRLYDRLLGELAALPAVHVALAGITLPNAPSVALHEQLGFSRCGLMPQVGRKFEQWWDVAWYSRPLV